MTNYMQKKQNNPVVGRARGDDKNHIHSDSSPTSCFGNSIFCTKTNASLGLSTILILIKSVPIPLVYVCIWQLCYICV